MNDIDKLTRFANGRCGVRKCNAPPDQNFAVRWRPTVAGLYVRLSNTPEHGYEQRGAALDAARRYKCECRVALTTGNKIDG